MPLKDVVGALDRERLRQGLTKASLAERANMQPSAVRKILSAGAEDVRVSTLSKIAEALGAELALRLVDEGLEEDQSRELMTRLRRRRLAEKIAARRGHDPGDVEHALRRLELTPTERLARSRARG